MNREDIIRMAREAGFDVESDEFFNYKPQFVFTGVEADLQSFADLVAATEREACARLAETPYLRHTLAAAIRARGKE